MKIRILQSLVALLISLVTDKGHTILQNPHLTFFPMECRSKVKWRFCKILWPSQNIWTLWKKGYSFLIGGQRCNLVWMGSQKFRSWTDFNILVHICWILATSNPKCTTHITIFRIKLRNGLFFNDFITIIKIFFWFVLLEFSINIQVNKPCKLLSIKWCVDSLFHTGWSS